MIDVLVVYDRSARAVREQYRFEDDPDRAFAKRLERERAYREQASIEVVLLNAVTMDDLKISHARYFDPASISVDAIDRLIEAVSIKVA